MPENLDHVRSRSKYAPWLVGKGADRQQSSEEALGETCTVPAEAVSKFDINSVSAVCHVKWELVTEQDVLCKRAGTSANP